MTILFIISISSILSITYNPACDNSYSSIVEALKSIRDDLRFANRKKIATLNGISVYTGTAAKLLNY